MKSIFLIISSILILNSVQAQTDTTDITLSINNPVLNSEMDSILFSGANFNSYQASFTISDTLNTGSISLEFTSNGQTINRLVKSLADLQNEAFIDSLWQVSVNFGNFDNSTLYSLTLVVFNYAGVANAPITKQF